MGLREALAGRRLTALRAFACSQVQSAALRGEASRLAGRRLTALRAFAGTQVQSAALRGEASNRSCVARHRLTAFIIYLASLLPSTTAHAEAASRTLRLNVGASEEVSFPVGTDLSVSRRGVVDVFHLGDGRWQVTALRGGFVVIDARDSATGAPRLPRLFVEVVSGAERVEAVVEGAATLPAWLCKAAGVVCDVDASILSGEVNSVLWFRRAKVACAALPGCIFGLHLTPMALSSWLSALQQALGEEYLVLGAGAGVPLLLTSCGRNGRSLRLQEVDALTGHLAGDGLVLLQCREDRSAVRLRLHTQLYLVESSAAEALGFDALVAGQLSLPMRPTNAVLLTKLHALAQEHRATLIGEPSVRLNANEPAELTSGGEFQVTEYLASDARGHAALDQIDWKQYGLMLKVNATPSAASRVRLSFEMSFKARAQGNEQSLSVHTLKSQTDLVLGSPTMAGVLDLQSSAKETAQLPVLAHIPIIGPLFRGTSEQASQSKLVLWFEVDEDEAQGELVKKRLGAGS